MRRPRVKDTSDFIDFVAWRQSAEYLSQYGHKGDIVAVSGALQNRKWKDKDGNNRISWEIHAESIELINSKKSENDQQGGYNPNSYAKPQYTQQDFKNVVEADADLPWET